MAVETYCRTWPRKKCGVCLPPTYLPAAHTYLSTTATTMLSEIYWRRNATNSGLRQVDEDGCGPLAAVKSDAVLHVAGAAGPVAHLPLEDNAHSAAHQSAVKEGRVIHLHQVGRPVLQVSKFQADEWCIRARLHFLSSPSIRNPAHPRHASPTRMLCYT